MGFFDISFFPQSKYEKWDFPTDRFRMHFEGQSYQEEIYSPIYKFYFKQTFLKYSPHVRTEVKIYVVIVYNKKIKFRKSETAIQLKIFNFITLKLY